MPIEIFDPEENFEIEKAMVQLFDEFGFCDCGNPTVILSRILDILSSHDDNGFLKVNDDNLIYCYILDKYGYIEHTSTIFYPVLTEKGKELLERLSFAI